ncbi:MAG: S9 family peptidase [Woeseia sp.]|nr:S9 family peptidase [Woeseia sp.]NNL53695.1 S9 family peptidase [Woeseia sp.]
MLRLLITLVGLLPVTAAFAVESTTLNDGNLILEDIPAIPQEVVDDLNRFQNVRSASVVDWAEDGESLYITTRFAEVNQIHRVDMPGGARHQLTFFNEPVGGVERQPASSLLTFTQDAGGSEFAQIFTLDPASGKAQMLTDGESRNGAIEWNRDGTRLAYQSTRRNGASNDIWIMDAGDPATAEVVLESPDGTWWGPSEFTKSGRKLLVMNYVSIADSRIHLLDLDSGDRRLLAGGASNRSVNYVIDMDRQDNGMWMVTNRGGEFTQLAWQSFEPGSEPEIVTADIPWDVDGGALSNDRRRGVFYVNENGRSALYLLDTRSRKYRRLGNLPVGIVYGVSFSPDDRRIALTINSANAPSDVYVMDLGKKPLDAGKLTRWTHSEVGGLDTTQFRQPELVSYPTFDTVDGAPREIPAWVYKPAGKGPYPVVISIHGGPEAQSRPYFSSTYQMWLAKLGVAVVVPNVRGSAGYGKSYLQLDNGMKREDSVRDIGALLDWIETQPDLDASRIAVFGGSYGGYMVLASATHYSERLAAAVDIVGISNFVTFLENTEDYRRDLRRVEYGDERDPAMRAHLEKISPLNNVEQIKVPMMIVQGENDPRVPVTEAEQMVEALRAQGETVWYMNALNEGHGYRKKENRDIYQQAVILFLRQHLVGRD